MTKYGRPSVLVDGRTFSLQEKGGVSQLWANVIFSRAWSEGLNLRVAVYPGYDRNVHLRECLQRDPGLVGSLVLLSIPPSDHDKFSAHEHEWLRAEELVRKLPEEPDMVVNTYYGENLLPQISRYLVTALDFAHEDLPDLAKKPSTEGVLRRKVRAFKEASALTFISNATGVRFRSLYPTFAQKPSRVIYLGHEQAAPIIAKAAHQVIHVGTRGGYKNFELVADGMEEILRSDHRVRFLVFGGEAADERLLSLKARFAGRVLVRVKPSDYEMDLAMRLSSVFVSASRYEGFGIPLLNALRFGTSPVVSDISVYRELGGEQTMYFNPDSLSGFVNAVRFRLERPQVIGSYNRTWDDVAEEYMQLIEEACGA